MRVVWVSTGRREAERLELLAEEYSTISPIASSASSARRKARRRRGQIEGFRGAAEMPHIAFICAAVDKWDFVDRNSSKCTVTSSDWRKLVMLIEVALFSAFVAIVGTVIVKVYEWRQDVLYGPYIRQNDHQLRQ
jgi:hypothetical protein